MNNNHNHAPVLDILNADLDVFEMMIPENQNEESQMNGAPHDLSNPAKFSQLNNSRPMVEGT